MVTVKRFGRRNPYSLRRALIMSILVVHISVFAATLCINFYVLFRISERQTLEETQNSLEYMEYQMDNLISNLTDIRAFLLQDKNVMEYIGTERSDSLDDMLVRINTRNALGQLISSYTYLDSISLIQWNQDYISVSKKRAAFGLTDEDRLPVQNSPAFRKLTASSALTWGGLYDQSDLFPNFSAAEPPKTVVCLLMPLVNIWHPGKTAAVSINIPAGHFNFLYSKNAGKGADISLFDETGRLLLCASDPNAPSDRQEGYGSRILDSGSAAGHFNAVQGSDRYQVIFRRDQKTGWYLAEEIPYSVFLKNILYLQSTTGITFLVSVVLILVICYLVSKRLLKSLDTISKQMEEIGEGGDQKRLPNTDITELNSLTDKFNGMMGKLELLTEDKIKDEQEKRVLEIEVLQAQINPHFLYNSLTTIRWMASMARAGNVCQALLALNNVLQPVFSHPGILWSLENEQTFIQNFVDIMNYRFGENIKCVYQIPEELESVQVLRFLLQPAVENSITHGLRGKPDSRIEIRAERSESLLILTIRDNGQGIAPADLRSLREKIEAGTVNPQQKSETSHGFGLYNVNRRIKLHYGQDYGITISSETGIGTTMQIRFPETSGEGQIYE